MTVRTDSRRARDVQKAALDQAERQYRSDVKHLLRDQAFQRFMAVEWFGHLGLFSDPCRSSAFEAQRASARIGVAVEQRKRLLLVDHAGVRAIDAAHHEQVAHEIGVSDALDQQSHEEEHTDD